MKVLHVVALGPDVVGGRPGPLNVALHQKASLVDWDICAEVFTTVDTETLQVSSMRSFQRRRIGGAGLSTIYSPALIRALIRRSEEFDLVHVHASRDLVCLPVMALLWLLRIPYVTQTHGQIEPGRGLTRAVDLLVTKRLLRHARMNFVLQEKEEHDVRQIVGQRARAAFMRLPNGVDVDGSWSPIVPRQVAFVAHLRPRKRVMMFLEMAELVHASRPDVRFVVAGPDGGDGKRLKEALSNPRLAGICKYLGPLGHEEAQDLTAESSVYVLPSVYDPYPMSLLEAIAIGTPSVCTSGCAIARELSTGGACVVSEPTAQALAASVLKLLESEKSLAEQSRAGRLFAMNRLSMRSVGERLSSAYRLALAGDR